MTITVRFAVLSALALGLAAESGCSSGDDDDLPCPECVYPSPSGPTVPTPTGSGTIGSGGTTGGTGAVGGTEAVGGAGALPGAGGLGASGGMGGSGAFGTGGTGAI